MATRKDSTMNVMREWAVLYIGFCFYLSFFIALVIGLNYAFRIIKDYKISVLIPIVLDFMFILYYAMHCEINTGANLLEYLFTSHFPFVAVSFCKKLNAETTHLRILRFILGLSALLYVFAIGNIIFALAV